MQAKVCSSLTFPGHRFGVRSSAPHLVDQAIDVANALKAAKHLCVFTGAGISTSTGIPDFRGPNGVWTLKAQGKTPTSRTRMEAAIPSYTHMALKALFEHFEATGRRCYLMSGNTDGLHRKSGMAHHGLSEFHGCCNVEYCGKCSREVRLL